MRSYALDLRTLPAEHSERRNAHGDVAEVAGYVAKGRDNRKDDNVVGGAVAMLLHAKGELADR